MTTQIYHPQIKRTINIEVTFISPDYCLAVDADNYTGLGEPCGVSRKANKDEAIADLLEQLEENFWLNTWDEK